MQDSRLGGGEGKKPTNAEVNSTPNTRRGRSLARRRQRPQSRMSSRDGHRLERVLAGRKDMLPRCMSLQQCERARSDTYWVKSRPHRRKSVPQIVGRRR